MNSFFITGTDTEIGKTFVLGALMLALRNRGLNIAPMKPVAAGTMGQNGVVLNEDVHTLLEIYGRPIDVSLVNPFCFDAPIAPHIAAAREHRAIEPAAIVSAFQQLRAAHDGVLVEGAGGFLVPLSATTSMSVLPTMLGLDVILVVGMRLGCINHALLTVEAIAVRGLRLAGWVANTVDPDMACIDENIATLTAMISAPCLGVLPRLPQSSLSARASLSATYLQIDALFG